MKETKEVLEEQEEDCNDNCLDCVGKSFCPSCNNELKNYETELLDFYDNSMSRSEVLRLNKLDDVNISDIEFSMLTDVELSILEPVWKNKKNWQSIIQLAIESLDRSFTQAHKIQKNIQTKEFEKLQSSMLTGILACSALARYVDDSLEIIKKNKSQTIKDSTNESIEDKDMEKSLFRLFKPIKKGGFEA